jgi:hypothetical protein
VVIPATQAEVILYLVLQVADHLHQHLAELLLFWFLAAAVAVDQIMAVAAVAVAIGIAQLL